jgi:hypothetical protein
VRLHRLLAVALALAEDDDGGDGGEAGIDMNREPPAKSSELRLYPGLGVRENARDSRQAKTQWATGT